MRPWAAWGLVAIAAAATGAALALPLPWAAALAAAGLALLRRRATFLAMAALGAALNAAIFAALLHGPGWDVGPLHLSRDGAVAGLAGATRLAAALAVNLGLLSRVAPEVVLDGLRLPPAATAFLAAVVAAANGLGRDLGRLVDAARLEGRWPRGRLAQARATAALLPPLLVLAVRQGASRRDALRLAGHGTAPAFAALVAVTAAACAGRLAMVAVPNDPVTYAVVFLGGLLFGVRIGAAAGAITMALTNVLLSGLNPVAFANAPAMALLGVMGGLLGKSRLARGDAWTRGLVAATCGAVGVIVFSVAADALTWAVVPDYRDEPGALRALVLAGLAFNALPAAAAAIVFAVAVGPVLRAADAAGVRAIAGNDRPGIA